MIVKKLFKFTWILNLGSVLSLAVLGVGDIFMKTGQSWGQGATQAAGMSPVMRHRVLRMWRWADKGNTMRWYHYQPPVPPPHNLHFYQVTWHWTPCSHRGMEGMWTRAVKEPSWQFTVPDHNWRAVWWAKFLKPPVACDLCGQASRFHVAMKVSPTTLMSTQVD